MSFTVEELGSGVQNPSSQDQAELKKLSAVLEPSQLSQYRAVPYGKKKLGRGVLTLMWALRIYVFLALPLVAYVFFSSLKA
ncbi:hypothetical protein [Ferroacidibacillus organovorans]|uniref:Uncharacterized protein n=1 Tax=Ferroacidibacillus organovorans TaxID=1765683 RepID=A0A162UTX8_9BACL|nr:hypothetical protein [Ferroacidibacillus organovorans]KYP82043.1 hypothetical protein AYJ22_04900 [Ferroacidibacillus organovorans]OAG94363.1 hypothetical protein AYW79_05720 [Ferroacidibacillus organovorans]OPG15240.1 hypothetical protein B2M26_12275 [Ferroacidibacillus organovorans]